MSSVIVRRTLCIGGRHLRVVDDGGNGLQLRDMYCTAGVTNCPIQILRWATESLELVFEAQHVIKRIQ